MATIYPGKGLGNLTLGSSLQSVLANLKASPTTFPSIKIIYSKKTPVKSPITVVLKYNGLRLRFDGQTQKLRLIEVVEWGKMKLTYKKRDVGSQGPLTYIKIYNNIFGPTFPGKFYHDHRAYILSYPGIAFSFQLSVEAVQRLDASQDIPKFLMSSNAPPCTSMCIFQGDYWWDVENTLFPHPNLIDCGNVPQDAAGSKKLPAKKISNQGLAIDSVWADEINGTCLLNFSAHPRSISNFLIKINTTTIQDVVMILGPPSERFFKQDSRLSIFNPEGSDEREHSTLFFNYFFLGIDICFDTSLRNATVKKIILHGNIPGAVSFQKYERCKWKLIGKMDSEAQQPTSEMKFDKFVSQYAFKETPMVLNRRLECATTSLNDDGMEVIGESDEQHYDGDKLGDWGLTDLYGAPGLVIEVLKNGDVASLTIY